MLTKKKLIDCFCCCMSIPTGGAIEEVVRGIWNIFLGWTHWNWASNTEPFSGRQDNIPLPHWSWPNMYLKHLFWPLHFENKNMKTSRHCLGEKTLKTHFSNQVTTVTKDQSGTIFNSSHSSTKKNKQIYIFLLHYYTCQMKRDWPAPGGVSHSCRQCRWTSSALCGFPSIKLKVPKVSKNGQPSVSSWYCFTLFQPCSFKKNNNQSL